MPNDSIKLVRNLKFLVLDEFDPVKCNENSMILRDEDKWIISKLNTLAKEVNKGLKLNSNAVTIPGKKQKTAPSFSPDFCSAASAR